MKQKINLLVIAIFIAVISLSSCETANNSEKVIDEFYEAFNNQDFSKIKSIAVSEIADLMKEFSESHYKEYGEVVSWEKYNTEVFTNDENTGAKLYYKCKYSKINDEIYVRFVVIEDGEDYKIAMFAFEKNQDIIDNYEENNKKAKETGIEYYDFLKNDENDEISKLLDKKYIIDAGNEEAFYTFVNNRREYYGKVQSYSINTTTTKVTDNLPVFIIVYNCVSENSSFVEEISFIKRGDEFKIYDYRYSDTFDGLKDL